MKILHCSDWHLGKILHSFSLLEDQRYYLLKLCDYIEKEKIDVLLISGDIYDRAVAPAQAVELLDEIFFRLASEMGVKVFAIAGNHDSPERISYNARLVAKSGVYLVGEMERKIPRFSLEDEQGRVNFYLLPYIDPIGMRRHFSEEERPESFGDLYEKLLNLDENKINTSERNILLAHGFFSGSGKSDDLIHSDSERNIGGADNVNTSLLADFDYVALGHLHAMQRAGGEFIRYSGSMLKYSLSEAKQKKGAILIELLEKGEIRTSEVKIPPLRDLRMLEGSLEGVLGLPPSDDYVYALLNDDIAYDAMAKLRLPFPNIIGLSLNIGAGGGEKTELEARRQKTNMELFRLFYKQYVGEEINDKREELANKIMTKVESEERK